MTAIEWMVWRTFKPVPKRFQSDATQRDIYENSEASRKARAILSLVREHGAMNYTAIAHEFGCSKQTAKRMTAAGVTLGVLKTRQGVDGRALVEGA